MTVTQLNRAPASAEGFSIEDLFDFSTPGDGYRYEIFEGRLVVSPPPAPPHLFATADLREVLSAARPKGFNIIEGAGVYASDHDYYIPDLVVLRDEARSVVRSGFPPTAILLAIEVVSPSSSSIDNVMKRHAYAKFGIQHYWIADPRDKTIQILELGRDESYMDRELLEPGRSWTASEPFAVTIDPAEVFRS